MSGQDSFHLVGAHDGFGIVGQEFSVESETPAEAGPHLLFLHRVGLVQLSFAADPELTAVAELTTCAYHELVEVVLEETQSLLAAPLRPATYRLDSQPAAGEVLTYRGIDYLFSDLPLTDRFDFTCWRLPRVGPDAPWPDVVSAGGVRS